MAKHSVMIAALSTVIALDTQQTIMPTDVRVIADQAEAVLSILDKRARGTPIADDDWRRLFTSDGYTVGWRMAVTIERRFGRDRLVDAFCDPRKLLRVYNDALAGTAPAPSIDRWTETLINQISQ